MTNWIIISVIVLNSGYAFFPEDVRKLDYPTKAACLESDVAKHYDRQNTYPDFAPVLWGCFPVKPASDKCWYCFPGNEDD